MSRRHFGRAMNLTCSVIKTQMGISGKTTLEEKKHKEKHGGFRGLVWRSVNEFKTYGENDVCSVDDASFMFKIINHFVNNTTERNHELLEIFDGIKKRYDVRNKSDPPNVVLPTNETELNKYCLGGGQDSGNGEVQIPFNSR